MDSLLSGPAVRKHTLTIPDWSVLTKVPEFKAEVFAHAGGAPTRLAHWLPVSLLPQVSLKCRAPEVSQCVFQTYEAILKNWIKSACAWTQPLPSETTLLSFTRATALTARVNQLRGAAPQLRLRLRSRVSISSFNSVSLFVDARLFQVTSRLIISSLRIPGCFCFLRAKPRAN